MQIYKPGDKVRIKPLSWFKQNCISYAFGSYAITNNFTVFSDEMIEYCDKILTIKEITINKNYLMYEANSSDFYYRFEDWMIEPAGNKYKRLKESL